MMQNLLNKSFITNFISLLLIAAGYVSPVHQELIKNIGYFALSGAITNWLAIYMLFEKVPFLYGSGVIPDRFEEFKTAIKDLMMQQFFTVQNIEQFIEVEERQGNKIINIEPLLNAVDYDKIYNGLVAAIMESSFAGMLLMLGGEEALAPIKEPFTAKMKSTLAELASTDQFKAALEKGLDAHKISLDLTSKIETVIDKRLNELTPKLVKEMVQSIIQKHLGWLVVWGGIFGGLIGALFDVI